MSEFSGCCFLSALGQVSNVADGSSRDVVARTCLRPSLLSGAITTPDAIPALRTARAPGKTVTVELGASRGSVPGRPGATRSGERLALMMAQTLDRSADDLDDRFRTVGQGPIHDFVTSSDAVRA